MKKTFVIILVFFLIIVAIISGVLYNKKRSSVLTKDYNKPYETYYKQEILGTTLISIINKAIDDNEKNGVDKPKECIYYQENETNSIKITVQFLEADKPIYMEDIAKQTSETFISFFATASFKCTKIEYHEKTNYVKSLYFEQIQK